MPANRIEYRNRAFLKAIKLFALVVALASCHQRTDLFAAPPKGADHGAQCQSKEFSCAPGRTRRLRMVGMYVCFGRTPPGHHLAAKNASSTYGYCGVVASQCVRWTCVINAPVRHDQYTDADQNELLKSTQYRRSIKTTVSFLKPWDVYRGRM